MPNVTALAMTFGERAAYSGRMFLIGQGTIFIALAILWGVLVLFNRLVVKAPRENPPAASQKSAPVQAKPAPAQAGVPQNNDAVIAAITAAVAATLAEENGGEAPAFRVVSFRRL